MGEVGKNLRALEPEFEHDFETLSFRLNRVYEELDELAHANQSKHDDRETIRINAQLDERVCEVYCEKDKLGRMHVRSYDIQGTPISEYWCNLAEEAPKHRAEAEGGKHLAGGLAPLSKPEEPPLSQIDSMVVMASILELSFRGLLTQKQAAITILLDEK